jgi:hypothetical protein
MRIRQRVEDALERDGRGEEATVEDRERSAYGRGEKWRREAGGSPQRSESEKRWRLAENQTRRWVRLFSATVPSASEMRDEAMGAVAQRAT